MPKPKKKKPTSPEQPKKQEDPEIDVDDAQIEPPRDDAFKKELQEDHTTRHLKERENHRG